MPKLTEIRTIKTLGDSLSDRGAMWDRYLGFIPMRGVSGLKGKSPEGSFTNGYAWSDNLANIIANKFIIDELKKNQTHFDASDISDAIIDAEQYMKEAVSVYSLQDEKKVKYKGKEFFLSYCEGGLTSYDYSWRPSFSISRFIKRFILSTLEQKRFELLSHDLKNKTSLQDKAETLIIEWSGANDLITVNAKPSLNEVRRIIYERARNVEKLIKHGYKHFVLFNLPDLALTPCFQVKSQADQENATACIIELNNRLKKVAEQLSQKYPDCHIGVFDVFSEFNDIYAHPEKYQLDKNKLTTPFVTSPEFNVQKNGTSPAAGFMFWDDKHPSADMHRLLTNKIYDCFEKQFNFLPPHQPTRLASQGIFKSDKKESADINNSEKSLRKSQ